MTIEPFGLAAILNAVMWPIMAIIALIVLRMPLTSLVRTIGQRIQKISLGGLSLDLATMTEVKPSTLDTDLRRLEAAPPVQSGPSSLENLFTALRRGGQRDYLVIDLGSETTPRWLTSRLYLLAFLISCFEPPMRLVFVETAGSKRSCFIGTCSADSVRWALARQYGWLEKANHSAFTNLGDLQFEPKGGFLADWQTSQFMNQFLENIRGGGPPIVPPVSASGTFIDPNWIPLSEGVQEHAKWVDGARLERLLGGALVTASVVLLPNKCLNDLTYPVLRQAGEFVAVVDPDRRFLNLIGRLMVLESLASEYTRQTGKPAA